ncbi:STP2 [Candida jiufengensis]|uniref:STP2 n=1 Tax=Candida jiufengensis TaxID=497108 RepID=UPI0022255EF5|nr:STP2 [Candida jiufengensis]KAI5954331.1 STP2 [Candida jiufengensis]
MNEKHHMSSLNSKSKITSYTSTSKSYTNNNQEFSSLISFKNIYDFAILSLFITIIKFIYEFITFFIPSYTSIIILQDPLKDSKNSVLKQQQQPKNQQHQTQLFPSINLKYNNESSKEEKTEDSLVPTTCSMGLTTRLLPVKNSKGELEWVFTEDDSNKNNELDAFKMPQNYAPYAPPPPPPAPNQQLQQEQANPSPLKFDHHFNNSSNELSPTISNSSNETSLSSKLESNTSSQKEHSISPNSSSSPYEGDGENDVDEEIDDENKIYQCPHCDANFKIRGYLTRHLKKHSTNKAYSCPFYDQSMYVDKNNITHKCHPNGGFSRRDTYKTHLKSRHFEYPKGTKTKDRGNSSGNCGLCGEFFNSSEIWCEIHVEGGECKFLPIDYKGKSRIKNRLRKKLQKNEIITDPELLPYASKVYEEVKEQKKLKKLAKQENKLRQLQNQAHFQHFNSKEQQVSNSELQHPHPTQSSTNNHIDTPTSISSSNYETSSIHSPYTPQSSKSPLSLMTNQYVRHQPTPPQQHYTSTNSTTSLTPAPYQFDQIATAHQKTPHIQKEDYDDEYCLDIDQLDSNMYLTNSQKNLNLEVLQALKLQQQYQRRVFNDQNLMQREQQLYQQQPTQVQSVHPSQQSYHPYQPQQVFQTTG